MATNITPENTIFVQLCFEGPDPYSQAGGLGTRVYNMGEALADMGYETHLFFIGDPDLPQSETRCNGRYVLHRWCQWISKYHPGGAYDGEDGKVNDYAASVPDYVCGAIVRPAAQQGRHVVVIAEDWHTVDALCNLSDKLHWHKNRPAATLMWNANNDMGFHAINWGRLRYVATITAVSKFMKHLMWGWGMNPLTVPNGIPDRMLRAPQQKNVRAMKKALAAHGRDIAVFKIGRFDPDKRWVMAVDAVGMLRERGVRPLFLMRGGIEPHGLDVRRRAAELGLSLHDLTMDHRPTVEESIAAIAGAPDADVLCLNFFLPEETVRLLYRCCACVFANSGFEPFGLVGLEVMAAGGIALTGATGEDYVVPFVNAISVESDDPRELVAYLTFLHENPEQLKGIKREAAKTAKQFTWDRVINNLIRRIEYINS